MSTITAQDHLRRLFGRQNDSLKDHAKLEDKVRDSIQSEINAVTTSVRAKAVLVRPSAIAFGVATLLTFFGVVALIGAFVVALAQALPLWAAFVVVGLVLLLLATGAATWAHRHLPDGPALPPIPMPAVNHPAGDQVHPWAD